MASWYVGYDLPVVWSQSMFASPPSLVRLSALNSLVQEHVQFQHQFSFSPGLLLSSLQCLCGGFRRGVCVACCCCHDTLLDHCSIHFWDQVIRSLWFFVPVGRMSFPELDLIGREFLVRDQAQE